MSAVQVILRRMAAVGRLAGMCISRLFPRDPGLMVFGAWMGRRYDDNPRYLFEEALRRGKRCVWIASSDRLLADMKASGLPCLARNTLKAGFTVLRARYWICSHSSADIGWRAFSGGAVVVNLWHGTPIKKIGRDAGEGTDPFWAWVDRSEKRLCRPYMLCSSAYSSSLFQSCFGLEPASMIELGQSRCDLFFNADSSANPLRLAHPGKRIILWMPTFRGSRDSCGLPFEKLRLELLDRWCGAHGAVLAVKLHEVSKGSLPQGFGNIVAVQDLPVQELLAGADVLVTDYSSCFVDYLLLNRPMLFFAWDLDEYSGGRSFYGDYRSLVPGPVCCSTEELLGRLDAVFEGADDYAAARSAAMDKYWSEDCRRPVAASQLEKILSL